jgi:hypothetical protein
MFRSHVRQSTAAQASGAYFEFSVQVMPHFVMSSTKLEYNYSLTSKQYTLITLDYCLSLLVTLESKL